MTQKSAGGWELPNELCTESEKHTEGPMLSNSRTSDPYWLLYSDSKAYSQSNVVLFKNKWPLWIIVYSESKT